MTCARLAVGCLALALAAAPAVAQDDDEWNRESGFSRMDDLRGGTTRLQDVGDIPPASLDSVDTGHSDDLDQVDTGHTDSLDSVDIGHTDRLDRVDTGRPASLDSIDKGSSHSIEQTRELNRGWQPPACDETPRAGSATPAGGDIEGWQRALDDAEEDLQTSQARWRRLELGEVRVRVEDRARQVAATQDARQKARTDYADARCDLLATLLLARRAGVPPGVLRTHAERLPEDINPF